MAGTLGKCGEIKVFCFFSSEKKNFLTDGFVMQRITRLRH